MTGDRSAPASPGNVKTMVPSPPGERFVGTVYCVRPTTATASACVPRSIVTAQIATRPSQPSTPGREPRNHRPFPLLAGLRGCLRRALHPRLSPSASSSSPSSWNARLTPSSLHLVRSRRCPHRRTSRSPDRQKCSAAAWGQTGRLAVVRGGRGRDGTRRQPWADMGAVRQMQCRSLLGEFEEVRKNTSSPRGLASRNTASSRGARGNQGYNRRSACTTANAFRLVLVHILQAIRVLWHQRIGAIEEQSTFIR